MDTSTEHDQKAAFPVLEQTLQLSNEEFAEASRELCNLIEQREVGLPLKAVLVDVLEALQHENVARMAEGDPDKAAEIQKILDEELGEESDED